MQLVQISGALSHQAHQADHKYDMAVNSTQAVSRHTLHYEHLHIAGCRLRLRDYLLTDGRLQHRD